MWVYFWDGEILSIFDTANAIIDEYGSTAFVKTGGDEVKTKAFLQPLRYKSNNYGGYEYKAVGVTYNERYVYIGKYDVDLKINESIVQMLGKKYIVKKVEPYFIGDEKIYVWALLAPYYEQLEDEYGTGYGSA